MTKGIDDKKGRIGGVHGPSVPEGIRKTGAVAEVEKAKKTSAVAGVGRAGSVGGVRSTHIMTNQERDQIFAMIQQEADKLFSGKKLPPGHKEIVEKAVKMTVDAALVENDEEETGDGGKGGKK